MKAPTEFLTAVVLGVKGGGEALQGTHVFPGGPDSTVYISTIKALCTLFPSKGAEREFASLRCPAVALEGRCSKTLITNKAHQAQKGIIMYARSHSLYKSDL